MKKITKIKQISNNKYELVIDDEKLKVYDDVLLECNIMHKQDITDEVYEKILASAKYYAAYNKVIKYISSKLRTEKEIREKLKKLEMSLKDTNNLIDKLKKEGYLNKDKYIKAFINDEILLSLHGPRKIAFSLKNQGFTDLDFMDDLNEIKDEIWQARVEKIIDKKIKANRNVSNRMLKTKLKKELNNLGYNEKYNFLIEKVCIDDTKQLEKDYQKHFQKLSRKYSGDTLKFKLKQKLYALGYDLSQIENIIK